MNQHEFQMQSALFKWAQLPYWRFPVLRLLRGSMNGVKLSKAQAGKAKAAGMLTGEHDVTLQVARCGYIGLSIELKYGRNKPTQAQLDYGAMLTAEGWLVKYLWSWEEAADLIIAYLTERIVKP